MNTLIVYDSAYGNTGKVTRALAEIASDEGTVRMMPVRKVSGADVRWSDVLVVGSPTQAGAPTIAIRDFLMSMPFGTLAGKQALAFDTRFAVRMHGIALRLLMRTIGFASPRIGKLLEAKGAILIAEPAGFIVHDKQGPLETGELERAQAWIREAIVHRLDKQYALAP